MVTDSSFCLSLDVTAKLRDTARLPVFAGCLAHRTHPIDGGYLNKDAGNQRQCDLVCV